MGAISAREHIQECRSGFAGAGHLCAATSYGGWRRGVGPGGRMAHLSLSYEECKALRDAAERIAPRSRSRDLVAALRVLQAVLDAVQQGRSLLDGERRSTSPTDSSP